MLLSVTCRWILNLNLKEGCFMLVFFYSLGIFFCLCIRVFGDLTTKELKQQRQRRLQKLT